MAAQEGAKRKRSASKPKKETRVAEEKARPKADKTLTETQEALVASQAEAERERQARVETEEALTDAKDVLAAAQAEVEEERQARIKTEKTLTETQEALAAAQMEAEEEGKARIETEKALTDAREALAAARKELERKHQSQGQIERSEDGEVRTEVKARKAGAAKTRNPQQAPTEPSELEPHSFTVKMTVDERGQPRWTTVKHAHTEKEDKFPGLDVRRLVAFMEECIRPSGIRGPSIASETLSVSDVQVFRMGAGEATSLFLNPDEAFLVQVRFQLGGSEARSLTAEEPPFEVEVHARELRSGTSTPPTTYSANLVKDVMDYTAQVRVPGLSRGLYRLSTLVRLQPPIDVTRIYTGPVIDLS